MGVFRRIWTAAVGGRSPRPTIGDGPNRPIRGSYDAAKTDGLNANHWAAADALDADSANSATVRKRIAQRTRYELANNGQGRGVQLTQANYVVGRGPKLRMQTGSDGFNRRIEVEWKRWSKRAKLARKLRTAIKAKVSDGEAFLMIAKNPAMRHPVKLSLKAIECEQVTTPYLGVNEPNKIDGVDFDEFDNPTQYHVLKYHPGGPWGGLKPDAETVDARFMLHLYREDRAGQHRGVGELHPSLNLFAQGRRYREATVAAAENIANFSILLKTQQMPDDGPDGVLPMTTLPIDKSMMTALPYGFDVHQPKAEQPSASFDQFTRSQASEQARPLSMPYNIAAADSSGYSFSGGKLDHLTYFVAVDVEQSEIEEEVLEPLFEVWFAEAVLRFGWNVADAPVPAHAWDWPRKPVIDEAKTANANKTDLSTGKTHRRRLLAEDGWDVDEEDAAAAKDLGISVQEYRRRLFDASLATKVQQAATDEDDDPPAGGNGRTNGRRVAAGAPQSRFAI